MFAAASAVHADLKFLDEATDIDSNTLSTELLENQFGYTDVDHTVEDNFTHYYTFLAYLDLSFSHKIGKCCQSDLKAHFDHCFNFVTMNKASFIRYLHYQSAPLPVNP